MSFEEAIERLQIRYNYSGEEPPPSEVLVTREELTAILKEIVMLQDLIK